MYTLAQYIGNTVGTEQVLVIGILKGMIVSTIDA